MSRSLDAMRISLPVLASAIRRYAYTFISYQGLCTASRAVPALDLRLLGVGGPKRRAKTQRKPNGFRAGGR